MEYKKISSTEIEINNINNSFDEIESYCNEIAIKNDVSVDFIFKLILFTDAVLDLTTRFWEMQFEFNNNEIFTNKLKEITQLRIFFFDETTKLLKTNDSISRLVEKANSIHSNILSKKLNHGYKYFDYLISLICLI